MKLFIKKNIKFIIVIVICLIGSSITTLATNYIFNSNEVSYDNTESGLHADEVQGAIDEVFQHATDYSEIKNKIGTGSLTTTSNTLIGGVNELNSNKINTSAIANNLTTTASGSVLDARQGKILNNNIGTLSSLNTNDKTSTVAAINELNSKLTPLEFTGYTKDTTNFTFISFSVYKIGRIVFVQGELTGSFTIDTNTDIVSGMPKPLTKGFIPLMGGYNGTFMANGYVTSTGKLRIRPRETGTFGLYLCFSYIAEN